MTEDVAFYVDLAREAEGPLVELAVGNGRVARRPGRPVGRSSASTRRRRCSNRLAPMPPQRGWRSNCARGTCASSRSTSRRRSSTARSARSCTCRPGPTGAAPSNVSRRRSVPAGGSHGTPSRSITTSLLGWTDTPGRTPASHDPVRGGRQQGRHRARRRRHELVVVGDQERVARAHRRRRVRARGALRWFQQRAVRRGQSRVRLRRSPSSVSGRPRHAGVASSPFGSRRARSARSTSSRCSASVRGSHRVERAVRVVWPQAVEGKDRHDRVGLFGDRQGQSSGLARRDRVDQRTRGVVDPVHVLRLGVGGREGTLRSILAASASTRASQNAMCPSTAATVQ